MNKCLNLMYAIFLFSIEEKDLQLLNIHSYIFLLAVNVVDAKLPYHCHANRPR